MKLFLLLIVVCLLKMHVLADLTVTLATGVVEGYERKSPNGTAFHAFQGIPYAKPPLGNLRFQPPEPAEKWNGTLGATQDGNRCYSVKKDTSDESEDCLYLSVFTPILNMATETRLPVMVFFYGGGFRDGAYSYSVYGPDYLIEKEVLLVGINYRLGPFGFLSTADEVLPGNVGLKDQQLGLKWVQQNIGLFGGDPDQVTIFGQSAGGASVGFHIVSKSSAGLFRAGIAESGSPISVWAYIEDPVPYGYELASLINSSVALNNSRDLLEYLRSVPAKDIDIASTKTTVIDHPLPVIEAEHEGAFLTQSMYESLEKGEFNRVPLLIGANSEEYIYLAADTAGLIKSLQEYDKDLRKFVPLSMNLKDDDQKLKVGKEIKEIYIQDGTALSDNLGLAIAFRSEEHFLNGVFRHAELQSNYTDVFLYKFSYAGPLGQNWNISLAGAEKDTHGEEMYYFFKRKLDDYDNSVLSAFPDSDVLTHKRMVQLWTNFAKYLNPTPTKSELLQNLEWPKLKPDEMRYVDIDTNLEIKQNVKQGRYLKWKGIFEKYAIPPLVTF